MPNEIRINRVMNVHMEGLHTHRWFFTLSSFTNSCSKDPDEEDSVISRAGVVRGQAGHSVRSVVRDEKGVRRIRRVQYSRFQ